VQKRRHFYSRFEICFHSRSQRHRFPIKIWKFSQLGNILVDFWQHFTAHPQKQPFLSFRLQFWQRYWIRRPRFPIRRGYLGNRNSFSVLFLNSAATNPPHSYFRYTRPSFVKSGSRLPLQKGIISTKFEAERTIPYQAMKLFLPIRYVTLWPSRLTFSPRTAVLNFSSRVLTFHQILATLGDLFLSYHVHSLTTK